MIEASAISEEVARVRGYRTIETKQRLAELGFSQSQCRVPTLLIPIYNVQGEIALYQARPDTPRIVSGKALKYETPKGARMVLDVPRPASAWIRDPSRPLFITEGARKADSAVTKGLCCVALLGVWNFRGSNEFGGKTALADWESIALNGRDVYIAFDSDVMTKPAVHLALGRLKTLLDSRHAHVRLVYLPSSEGGGKVGLDDFFAAGHVVDDLFALATPELRRLLDDEQNHNVPYRDTSAGLVYVKTTQEGEIAIPLTNFSIIITSNVARDDGERVQREFDMLATVHGKERRFTLPAAQFAAMSWVTDRLGAGAIVYAGLSIRDHTRAAIQVLSGDPPERTLHTHTGWRRFGETWRGSSGSRVG